MISSAVSYWSARKRTMAKVVAKAVPGMILGGIIPGLCFLVGRREWGLAGGVVLVLLWSGAYTAVRWIRTRSVSGLVILYILVLLARGAVALVMNSAQWFFIAPAVVTAIGGCVFIGSALLAKPLVAPVVNELIPNSVLDLSDPRARVAMIKVSALYGVEQLVNAAVLILMVKSLSTTLYVALHGVVSWAIMGICILAGIPIVWKDLRAVIHWDHQGEQPDPMIRETLELQTSAGPVLQPEP
jgi:intracellular septation protein A